MITFAIRRKAVWLAKRRSKKMLQTVRNNDISFDKVVAHDQLSHLVINKINDVAMATTSKNPKWNPLTQTSDFIYIFYIYIYIYIYIYNIYIFYIHIYTYIYIYIF